MQPNATLYLLVGPVGAGKTTWAARRAASRGGLVLDLDAWMVRLFGADPRPPTDVIAWYLERRERCRALMWDLASATVAAGCSVYVELGLVGAAERAQYYDAARELGAPMVVVLVDAPREVRRERVFRRNAGSQTPGRHVQVVPPEHFERASDLWEPLSEAERRAVELLDA